MCSLIAWKSCSNMVRCRSGGNKATRFFFPASIVFLVVALKSILQLIVWKGWAGPWVAWVGRQLASGKVIIMRVIIMIWLHWETCLHFLWHAYMQCVLTWWYRSRWYLSYSYFDHMGIQVRLWADTGDRCRVQPRKFQRHSIWRGLFGRLPPAKIAAYWYLYSIRSFWGYTVLAFESIYSVSLRLLDVPKRDIIRLMSG